MKQSAMYKGIASLVMAFVVTGLLAVMNPAQAQVSIRIGPPPSRHHVWVPERRVWNGRRYVYVPGHWERRQAQRWERERRREERRAERQERRREERRWEQR